MQIGYARVSTQAQSLDRQIGALNAVGVDRIFREKATGKTVKGRPQLEKAIDALGPDDVFVIGVCCRMGRNPTLRDLMPFVFVTEQDMRPSKRRNMA